MHIRSSEDRVIYVVVAVALAIFAAISFNSAPTIGRHDGAWAYVIVTGVAAVCTMWSMAAILYVLVLRD